MLLRTFFFFLACGTCSQSLLGLTYGDSQDQDFRFKRWEDICGDDGLVKTWGPFAVVGREMCAFH
jgi:hypothetical protein